MELLILAASKLGLFLFFFGIVCVFVTGWMLVLKAFQENILWGLAYLLIPIAAFIFIIRFWSDTRRAMYLNLVAMGITLLGGGLIALDPAARAHVQTVADRQVTRFEELKEVGSTVDPRQPSSSLRKQEALFAANERERARAMEYRRRATELYAFVQQWREELLHKQPGDDADEIARENFRLERENYQGLLEEYKKATEEVKKVELELFGPQQAPSPESPQEPPQVVPESA